MNAAELDRWFVRTDAYLDAIEDHEVQYVTVRSRPARWPLVVFGFTIAMTSFAIIAMALMD